jgi:hypothetical protein
MTRLARMLLALCLALAAPIALAETVIDNARLQAARRFVVALGIGELFVDGVNLGFANEVKKNPERANETRWILEKITIVGAIERLAPVYAEYLTASQSDELRNFYSASPGRKIWQALTTAALAKQPPVAPALSTEETRQIMAFNATSSALRTLKQSQPAIDAKMETITKAWLQEIVQGNIGTAGRQIADALDPAGASAAATDGAAPAGPMAEFVSVMRTYNERNQKSITEFQGSIDAIDLSTVLRPASLTSRQGIAEGHTKIDRYELAFSRRWREYNANADDLMLALKKIPVSQASRENVMGGVEKGLTTVYERALRMQENQRNLMAIFREMLNLADEKFARIKMEENRLVFDSSADLQAYETLRERLKKEAAVETKISEEEQQARESSLRLLRGEGKTKP